VRVRKKKEKRIISGREGRGTEITPHELGRARQGRKVEDVKMFRFGPY